MMLRLKLDSWVTYPEDCHRIRRVLSNHGVEATIAEAEAVWSLHSEGMAAGWLFLPKNDDELWQILYTYVEDVPDYWDEVCQDEDIDYDEDWDPREPVDD
jgi:hypothetical protein